MADKTSFPQIPRPVWYGVRSMFSRSLSRRLDENALAAALDVQPSAAKQYLLELRRVGLINEEGAPTELAAKWRSEDGFDEAIQDILKIAYPENLVALAPAKGADRAVVERWFKNHGLGEGTAKNKAATYLMIANGTPTPDQVVQSSPAGGRTPRVSQPASKPANSPRTRSQEGNGNKGTKADQTASIPLNVNVQIHISADATSDQIETIFSAMRKYLYESGDSESA